MSSLREDAIRLAEQGWEVFPLDGDKRPINPNGFHGATKKRVEVLAFPWERAGGIGAAIPEGHFAVDIDPRSDGDKTVQALKNAGLNMPGTRIHGTRGGGTHRFYALPDEFADRRLKGTLGPGIDIKAAGKGYVVMPPSPGYEVKLDRKVAEAPAWMVEHLLKPEAGQQVQAGEQLPKFFDQWEVGTKYGVSAMEGEIGRLLMAPDGTRNNALNSAAFSLGQLCAGGELQEAEAWSRLEEAAARIGDNPEKDLATIRSGWEAGMLDPREAPKQDKEHTSHGQPVAIEDEFSIRRPDDERSFWLDWENADDTPPPFYLWPIIPKNAYVLVYGATEASKSMVLLALACEASHRGIKTSVYSLENPGHIDIDRIRRLGPMSGNFRITNQMLDLNDARQVHELVKREQENGTHWLVIDTYSHAFNTRTEDGNAKAIEFARRIRYIMQEVGCTVLLVDHTGYADHGEPRDASAKRQQVDMAIKMERTVPWAPGQPSRWSMENKKSARFGNPFFIRGQIKDGLDRKLELIWEPGGPDVEWRDG